MQKTHLYMILAVMLICGFLAASLQAQMPQLPFITQPAPESPSGPSDDPAANADSPEVDAMAEADSTPETSDEDAVEETKPVPPMVERHIFTPGPQPDAPPAPPRPSARPAPPPDPQREILFTGVMRIGDQRRALIRETGGRGAGDTRSRLYTEGEEVRGLTIREIGNNYIILDGPDTPNQRLNLYVAGRDRPAAPAAPLPPGPPGSPVSDGPPGAPPQPGAPPGTSGDTPSGMPGAPSEQATAIFGPGGPGGSQPPDISSDGQGHPPGMAPPQGEPPSNPFLEIMRRAAERRDQMGRSSDGNPLLDAFGGGQSN